MAVRVTAGSRRDCHTDLSCALHVMRAAGGRANLAALQLHRQLPEWSCGQGADHSAAARRGPYLYHRRQRSRHHVPLQASCYMHTRSCLLWLPVRLQQVVSGAQHSIQGALTLAHSHSRAVLTELWHSWRPSLHAMPLHLWSRT